METLLKAPRHLSNAVLLAEFKNAAGRVYASIWYDASLNLICDYWEGAAGTPGNFQAVLLDVIKFAKQHKAKRWLADLGGMQGGFQKNEDWLKTFVMVEAEKAGITSEAVVMPGDVFAKFSAQKTAAFLKGASGAYNRLTIEAFQHAEKALEWLIKRA